MIAPTSNIYLMKNVPLYPDYVDTVSYADETSQFNDLTTGATILNNYTYVRQTNTIKVGLAIGKVFDVNYLCYKNAEYENKWIYCFVTRVAYVNDNVSELFFEIDVMQTFFLFGRYLLGQQYVERTHTVTDNLGEHYLEEGLPTGVMCYESQANLFPSLTSVMGVVVAVADTSSVGLYDYEGILNGATLYGFRVSNRSGLVSLLSKYTAKPESILSIYIVPWVLIADSLDSNNIITDGYTAKTFTFQGSTLTGTEDFGGYTPKNKKLYTFPYNYYSINNNNDTIIELRFERFTNFKVQIEMKTTINQPVSLSIQPKNYKGVDGTIHTERIVVSNFPQCSWANDSYSTWIAQNSATNWLSFIPSLISTLAGALTGNIPALITGGMSALNTATGTISNTYQASQTADQMIGNSGGNTLNVAHKEQGFFGGRCHVSAEYAEMIDNYFDRYGYKVNKNMVLNLRARPYWTYIKTIAADVQVSCPAQYKQTIDNALNRGVTFWKDKKASVGLYGRDNSPT